MTEPAIRTPVTAELVHGAVELQSSAYGLIPHRLSTASRAQLGGPVEPKVFSDPSGVRVRFHTAATHVELVTRPQKHHLAGGPVNHPPVYDIWCDGRLLAQQEATGGTLTTEYPATGQVSSQEQGPGGVVIPDLPARDKTLEIWLPYQEPTELIEIRSDAAVHPVPAAANALHWVHYGSSISHGYDALGASHTWPAVVARTASAQGRPVELTNLGFAGNAKLDPFAARTIRDLEAEFISLKLGINVVNGDSHSLRAFSPAVHGFLDILREGPHAQTPILVVSPLWCGIHEQTPGPVEAYDQQDPAGTLRRYFRATGDPARVAQGRLNLEILRAELERILLLRAESDPNLHFLSGLELYGAGDAEALPLPDSLHPSHEAHQLIGSRFAAHLR